MVLHNPNNWHWVNKDVSAWARDYLGTVVQKLEAEDGGVTAKINKLVSMDGDVDVSQRKGKVITIYDVKLVLEYSGTYSFPSSSAYFCHLPVHLAWRTSNAPPRQCSRCFRSVWYHHYP